MYSILVVNFYLASITSTLIEPQEHDIIKTWNDLQRRNFTLLYIYPTYLDDLIRSEVSRVKSRQSNVLDKLLQNAIAVPFNNFSQFMAEHKFHDGLFSIDFVVGAINTANAIEATIQTNAQTETEQAWKCRVGKELLFSAHILFGFLPPDNYSIYTI